MSFLTNLWADLVEKRLWPVAVVLLIALVGVPVALGGPSGEPVGAVVPAGATGATGPGKPELLVALQAPGATRANRSGRAHDPFSQPGKASGAEAPTGPVAAVAGLAGVPGSTLPSTPKGGGSSPGGGGGSAPGSTNNTPSTATTGTTTAPTPKAKSAPAPAPAPAPEPFLITLRIGRAGGDTPKARDVRRLTPLPSAANPFFVALGVLSNQKTAVFMLSADVKATGEGTCRPRPSSCETLELHKGDTERLVVTGDDGKVRTYRLELVRITKTSSADSPRATAARHRAAKQGTSVTKESPSDELGSAAYSYDGATGLLTRLGSTVALGGHLPTPGGATPRSAPLEHALPAAGLAAFPVYSPGL